MKADWPTIFNYAGRCARCGMALWRDQHNSRRLYAVAAGFDVTRCFWLRKHRLAT